MSSLPVRFQKKELELNPLTEASTYQEVPRKIGPLPMGGLIVKIMEDHRHTLLVSQHGNQQPDVMTVVMIEATTIALVTIIQRVHENCTQDVRSLSCCRMNANLSRSWKKLMHQVAPD
jgi:hypothetical protein